LEDIQKLVTVYEVFANFIYGLTNHEQTWNDYYNHPTPEMIDIPLKVQYKLDSLQ
jgi:hypothetical protein